MSAQGTSGSGSVSRAAAVHPIATAWLGSDRTGAKNYDEFADDAEITAAIRRRPESALAVEMPHRAPDSPADFDAALPLAKQRLLTLERSGALTELTDVVFAYRITERTTGRAALGLWAMVDTDQISTAADEPGLVIRNEDVFPAKVAQRVELLRTLGRALSPVLLIQTEAGAELAAELAAFVDRAGPPATSDDAEDGTVHEIWPIPAGDPSAVRLLRLAGGGSMVVADGNHRSLAAEQSGIPRFLAVITPADALTIAPYHRLVRDLPMPYDELLGALRTAGATVADAHASGEPGEDPRLPNPTPGTVVLYGRSGGPGHPVAVRLPPAAAGAATETASTVDDLDHARVEDVILRQLLRMDPGDQRISYVGGSYPTSYLADQVDAGAADLAIAIAEVSVEQFVAVNLAREQMPRKSTWFVPKARAGLVIAEVDPRR